MNCDLTGFGDMTMVCGIVEPVEDAFTNLTLLIVDSIRLEGLCASNVKDRINRSSGSIVFLNVADLNWFRFIWYVFDEGEKLRTYSY